MVGDKPLHKAPDFTGRARIQRLAQGNERVALGGVHANHQLAVFPDLFLFFFFASHARYRLRAFLRRLPV